MADIDLRLGGAPPYLCAMESWARERRAVVHMNRTRDLFLCLLTAFTVAVPFSQWVQ